MKLGNVCAQAVVSYDRKHWARTDTEYDEQSGTLVIKHTPKYVRDYSRCQKTAQLSPQQ